MINLVYVALGPDPSAPPPPAGGSQRLGSISEAGSPAISSHCAGLSQETSGEAANAHAGRRLIRRPAA
jgi:hypothetical protein